MTRNVFLITGASDGIGAVYAERLARRGNDLVLVARRADGLAAFAEQLTKDHGISVEILAADLSQPDGLAKIETRLPQDATITGLVNNAGIAGDGPITALDPAHVTGMINLNVLAVTRLAAAIAPRLAASGKGTIINITSVTALMPSLPSIPPPRLRACLYRSVADAASLRPVCGFRVCCPLLPGLPSGKRRSLRRYPPRW